MRTKIFMVVLLMSISAVLFAQTEEVVVKKMHKQQQMGPKMEQRRDAVQGLNLTDAQKEAFKAGMIATQKKLQPLKNELGEAEAHQRTLVTAEKPDLAAINKNIEKIGALKVEMAKVQIKNRMEMRAQLNDEQRLKFDNFRMHERDGKGPKGPKGMK
jgi:Spy/CpxP family protein refolding chaperone